MKGAELISEFLSAMEIPSVFGVSGANCEDIFESLFKKGKTKIFLSKSEYGAATMAIGHYLSSLKTGVVVTTSGPGILNTIPVLSEAFTSKLPLLLIAGGVPTNAEGEGAFQDTSGKADSLDLESMLKSCTCFVKKILKEEEFIETLQNAYIKCLQEKKPAVVLVPKDLSQREIYTLREFVHPEGSYFPAEITLQLQTFVDEMTRPDTRPLIVYGDDCVHLKNKKALTEFAEKCEAPVVVTPNAKGCFDHSSRKFAGLLGIMGHDSALTAFKNATHVLFIGFHATALNLIGINEEFQHKKKFFLSAEPGVEEYLLTLKFKVAQKKAAAVFSSLSLRNGFYPETILSVIQKYISKDANVFVDAGNTGAWVVHHFKCSGLGLFCISLGMGGMGNSIGAAIGAAALRQKRSVAFMGDGSFLIQGMEIHTALQYSLPVTFFIFNNNAHEMCSTREKLFLSGETGINRFKPSFYANGILKMFPGLPAREIYSIDDLEECMSDFKSVRGPVVISLNCNETDHPPFLTFKRSQS